VLPLIGYALTLPQPAKQVGGLTGRGIPLQKAQNPADTLYGVTIAIAVDGLYRTYQLTGDERYLDAAVKSLSDYSHEHSAHTNEAIYFHYSDQPADYGYRVANITAMLMAQYAKVGAATQNSEFITLADKAYKSLMIDSLSNEKTLSWHYLGNSPKPRGNDLIHAAFIVYGLHLYVETKPKTPEIERILNQAALYLEGFVLEEKVYEFHRAEKPLYKNPRARSWAVGMLMFAAKQIGNNDLAKRTAAVISEYEFSPGKFSYRHGDQLHSPRAVAFLLLGVA